MPEPVSRDDRKPAGSRARSCAPCVLALTVAMLASPRAFGADEPDLSKLSLDQLANLEVTLICERPKIGPLRDAMRARISEISGVNISRVAVKATTSERLGFTGREEGIAATASATIRLPWSV